jgi:hypothetical protein
VPIAVASRPLIIPTAESSTRERASASTTTSRAVLKSGSAAASAAVEPRVRMLSTMYCCNFGGTSSATTPTNVSRQRITAPRV